MMTATRIARAGRIRFFIGLGVLVITMGFVAMFHSSQQQLDESKYAFGSLLDRVLDIYSFDSP